MTKNIFLLGRQPNLGIAELESLLGSENLTTFSHISAVSNIEVNSNLQVRLGGTQKIGRIILEKPLLSWPEIEDTIKKELVSVILNSTEGKINLGISCYGVRVKPSQLNGSNIALKKIIKQESRPIRIVPNKTEELSTAQVLHNNLISIHGFELIIVQGKNSLIFAQTISIQDINAYANRDQNRPKRDARVGMLPPKLAQIMLNLANPLQEAVVLDPFCGTGVILQEALLMGFSVIGTDLNERMVDYSRVNLDWLNQKFNKLNEWKVEVGDATNHIWKTDFNSVVCETLLGKPLVKLPSMQELRHDSDFLDKLITKFLINIGNQIKNETKICIAIPAWVTDNGFITLPLLDHLEKIGYNRMRFKNVDSRDLIYFRPNQLVARQLLVLIRK